MSFGSQRGFSYTSDEGNVYNIRADESNTELINNTQVDFAIPSATSLPRDTFARYVALRGSNGSTKKTVILTVAKYNAISIGQQFTVPTVGEENPAGTTFTVVRKVPERVLRRPVAVDTGKNDGD